MARIWTWGLRNPLIAVALVSTALAGAEVISWGLGLAGASVAAIVADVAHRLGRRARAKQRRALAARRALAEAMDARQGARKESGLRRAA